jgi:NAD(P)-dependent dehydrogenase (short-subunit alcohol dehydrogenase family)
VGPGLGWSAVKRFASAGLRAYAVARDSKKLQALAASASDMRDRIVPLSCDTADPKQVGELFARVEKDSGPPAAVVYNAGAFQPGSILDITPQTFINCWQVGCLGGFLVGQAAARSMVAHGKGTLIFTGATASLRGGSGFANLAVPKFGLRALAQSMARELGPKGVHVAHVVIDGQIDSERYRGAGRASDTLLQPDAIAEAYWQLHQQPREAWTFEMDMRPWCEKF